MPPLFFLKCLVTLGAFHIVFSLNERDLYFLEEGEKLPWTTRLLDRSKSRNFLSDYGDESRSALGRSKRISSRFRFGLPQKLGDTLSDYGDKSRSALARSKPISFQSRFGIPQELDSLSDYLGESHGPVLVIPKTIDSRVADDLQQKENKKNSMAEILQGLTNKKRRNFWKFDEKILSNFEKENLEKSEEVKKSVEDSLELLQRIAVNEGLEISDGEKVKTVDSLVEYFNHYSPLFVPGVEKRHIPRWADVFEALNEILLKKSQKLIFVEDIFEKEATLKGFIWNIGSSLIKKNGPIGIFQTTDIKDYLIQHPDLSHLRGLLNYFKQPHWKVIEIGFLKCHLEQGYNSYSLPLGYQTLIERFKGKIPDFEKHGKFELDWLDIFNMNHGDRNHIDVFFQNVFVYHIFKYFKRYFPSYFLEDLIETQTNFFEIIIKVIQRSLSFRDSVSDPEFVKSTKVLRDLMIFLNLDIVKPPSETLLGKDVLNLKRIDLQGRILYMNENSPQQLELWRKRVSDEYEKLQFNYRKFTKVLNRETIKAHRITFEWLASDQIRFIKEEVKGMVRLSRNWAEKLQLGSNPQTSNGFLVPNCYRAGRLDRLGPDSYSPKF